jgi:dephospho-CoA kinase
MKMILPPPHASNTTFPLLTINVGEVWHVRFPEETRIRRVLVESFTERVIELRVYKDGHGDSKFKFRSYIVDDLQWIHQLAEPDPESVD